MDDNLSLLDQLPGFAEREAIDMRPVAHFSRRGAALAAAGV